MSNSSSGRFHEKPHPVSRNARKKGGAYRSKLTLNGLYQWLLRLYPAEHRREFGDEMSTVFSEARGDLEDRSSATRALFLLREFSGVVSGAIREHLRGFADLELNELFSTRRFDMRNGFRFPKATAILMTIIFLGVVMAIRKGEMIANSLPHVNPTIPPIVEGHSALLPPIGLYVGFFYVLGLIVWLILYALRRTGVQRLDDVK